MRNVIKCLILVLTVFAGCGKEQTPVAKPLIFWHGQSDQKAQVLRDIVRRYNQTHPPLTVQEEYVGDYDTLYKKTMSALMAKRPPDLVCTYESMVADFVAYHPVVDFASYLEKETAASGADIYPVFLSSNRYEDFDGKMLSMPFTKSVLMLYYNLDMLNQIGQTGPPVTWEQFLADCRALKKKRKEVSPLAFSRDASTFDAMIFSFGGRVYDAKTHQPLPDTPPVVRVLALLGTLFQEKLAHQVAYNTFDDRNDFADQRSAFFIRSSTSRPYVAALVKNKFKWSMAVIPRGSNVPEPRTVLFGMNISVFRSAPERERAAWEFIRYFISRDVTAEWATRTGYLPVRQSALAVPMLKQFLAEHPANRQAINALAFARSEPKVRGWQEIRTVIEKTISDVIDGQMTPEQAARSLQTKSRQIIKNR